MRKYFVYLFVILFACLFTTSFAQDDNGKLKQTIDDLNVKFSKAYIDHDNEFMLAYYTDDAISMPSYSPMMKGKEAIRNGMDMEKNANYKVTNFNLKSSDIITNGNLVCDIGTYEMTMEMENSDKPFNDNGKYMTVYEKQPDGSLKIKAEIWNSNINPWMKNSEEN